MCVSIFKKSMSRKGLLMMRRAVYSVVVLGIMMSFVTSAMADNLEVGGQEISIASDDIDQTIEFIESDYTGTEIDEPEVAFEGEGVEVSEKMVMEEEVSPIDKGYKVMVNKISVTGVESINYEKVLAITMSYEGQELTLDQLHSIAEEISGLYADKGYVTSHAYIPEQDITEGYVEILVVEGKVGDVIVVGNERFGENIFRVDIEKRLQGEILDYTLLKGIVRELNSHPDRTVSVSLKPGEEKGFSDVVMHVEEDSLSSISIGFNRMGTELTGKERYSLNWRRSNLFGFDDQIVVSGIVGKGVWGASTMYLVPINDHRTKLGIVSSYSEVDVGGTHKPFGIEARSKTAMVFLQRQLMGGEKTDINGRLGLRVTDTKVRAPGSQTAHDDITVFLTEFDFVHRGTRDHAVARVGVDLGIPDFLGSGAKDHREFSRTGSEAGFEKYRASFDYSYRLPWDFTFVRVKGNAQYSPDNLVTAEQISLNGFNAVRGFEESTFRGDTGGHVSLELYTPTPLFPNAKIPFADRTLKESVQLMGFVDYGIGHTNEQQLNEFQRDEFKSVGVGLRFKLYKNMYARLEVGFPIDEADRKFEDSKVHFSIQTELF